MMMGATRLRRWVVASAISSLCAVIAVGQQPAQPLAQQPSPSPGQDDRLERHQSVIENTQDSGATRLSHASDLVRMGTSRSIELIAALLRSTEPSTPNIVCRAIAAVGREDSAVLADAWIEPIIIRLAIDNSEAATSAAEAIAEYRTNAVNDRLSAIAADAQMSAEFRQAAIAALEPNIDQRRVVSALINLMDVDDPKIVERVISILRTVSLRDYGNDRALWREWWNGEQAKTDTQWIADHARHLAREARLARLALQSARTEWDRESNRLTQQLAKALSANYRLTPPQDQEALLVDWLADARREYREAAVILVAERISEGQLPGDVLRSALRDRFTDVHPDIRKQAVETTAALNDPADAETMLARLNLERTEAVREALLRALGKLRNPIAVEPLIEELRRPDAPLRCVTAAADAVAKLAVRDAIDPSIQPALIETLKSRFASIDVARRDVRIAILEAMSEIGDPAFKPEFEANLSSDDPGLLLWAIQGVKVVGNGKQLDRLVELTAHPDARVRQRAIEAVGELGGAEQLKNIADRLDEDIEPLPEPRDAATRSFRSIAGRLTPQQQLDCAELLSRHTALQAEYLAYLHESLSKQNPQPPILDLVRERLAQAYVALDRKCEAITLWGRLLDVAVRDDGPRRDNIAIELLQCALACNRSKEVGQSLSSLSQGDARQQAIAEDAVLERLSTDTAGDTFTKDINDVLSTLPEALYGRLRKRLAQIPSAPPLPSPSLSPSSSPRSSSPSPAASTMPSPSPGDGQSD